MFASMGFMEIIVLGLLLGPASGPTDLASLLNAEAYFQNNNIPVQADKLIELASKAPADTKGRLTQLLAIRWLEENAAKLGEQKKAAQTALQKLAQGPQGFARAYAARALARIDGKPVPVLNPMPKDSVRVQALEWFPADVSFAGALDLRQGGGSPSSSKEAPLAQEIRNLRDQVHTRLPQQVWTEIYRFAESVGNLRLDRVAFAFDADPPMREKGRIFIRLTGAGDGKQLVEFLKQQLTEATVAEEKGPKGETIRIITHRSAPAFVLIGDTDLIMTGYQRDRENHRDLVQQILDVRSGKKPSVLKGALAKDIQAAGPEARGLLVGALPEDLRRALAGSPLGVAPKHIAFALSQQQTATGFTLALRFRGQMEKEADTRALLDGFNTLKLMAVKALDDLGKPKDTLVLKKTVQSAGLKGDGATVTGQATISAEAIQAGLKLMMELIPKEIRP